jgi:hypothetical protein
MTGLGVRQLVHMFSGEVDQRGHTVCLWCDQEIPTKAWALFFEDGPVAVTTTGRARATFWLLLDPEVVDRSDGVWFGEQHFRPCDVVAQDLEQLTAAAS